MTTEHLPTEPLRAEHRDLLPVLFESVSAFATVGLSMGEDPGPLFLGLVALVVTGELRRVAGGVAFVLGVAAQFVAEIVEARVPGISAGLLARL